MFARTLTLLIMVLLAAQALSAERRVTLSVPGMFCASCPYVVQAAAGAVDGVISVTTDADERQAVVMYDDALTSVGMIRAALRDAGYPATALEADS